MRLIFQTALVLTAIANSLPGADGASLSGYNGEALANAIDSINSTFGTNVTQIFKDFTAR